MQAALYLAPVLAAEKSKVPFYIAGGVLVLWALTISLAIGLRKARFPENDTQQRAVMGITVVLVAAALVSAVATAGTPAKTETAGAAAVSTPSTAETSTATAPAPASTQPTATTGTPAPPSSPAAKAAKLALAADPGGQLAYSTTQLSAKAGTVTIEMTNMSPVEHNVTVEEGNKKVLGATPTFAGGKRSLTLKLAPGTYTFFCSVPGHRQAGMEGKLVVSS
ncbi:MAG TPA: plastocyanin/azurin family copper-binding protein [Solirubrobacteraceae bacterium]|nr:plastocyanin/azurin family copper-binding protein [Solirubrobacteraceae bacterium]